MTPTLEEVKEHFKDAKIVESSLSGTVVDIDNDTLKGIHLWNNEYFFGERGKCIVVWSIKDGYSEIIEYKQETPERYKTNSIDVIDICKLYDLNFNLGNIVKYACRKKGQDKEDLVKIIDYANRELQFIKEWEQIEKNT